MALGCEELDALATRIAEELPEKLENLLVRLNQSDDGRLEKLLELLEMQDFLQQQPEKRRWKSGKIAIIGACEVGINDLARKIKKMGFNPDRLELCLDYDENKRKDFSYLKNTKYAVILGGQLSHKGKNIGSHASLLDYLADEKEGFPPLVRLTKNNQNRISVSSVTNALRDLVAGEVIMLDSAA